jgi:DNA-directed RNA polymerase I, II, and III subunit RPABC1
MTQTMSSNIPSDRIKEIYKSRRNLLAILKKQGYAADDYDGVGIADIAIMAKHGQLDMMLERGGDDGDGAGKEKPSGTGNKLYVRYIMTSTFRSPDMLSNLVEDLYAETLGPNDDLIIVAQDDPNEKLMKLMEKLWIQEKIYVRVIGIKRLQFNILEHALVPQHTILSSEERESILKKYNVTDATTQLPVISRFDPVANVIGIRPGQVCEIKRSSRTAVTANYYRVCV